MRNFYLDPLTGDLLMKDNNFVLEANNTKYWAQKLETDLKLFYTEWFLNKTIGMPYYQNVFGKRNLNDVNAAFQSYIQGLSYVEELVSFEISFNSTTRTYFMNNLNVKINGTIIEIEDVEL